MKKLAEIGATVFSNSSRQAFTRTLASSSSSIQYHALPTPRPSSIQLTTDSVTHMTPQIEAILSELPQFGDVPQKQIRARALTLANLTNEIRGTRQAADVFPYIYEAHQYYSHLTGPDLLRSVSTMVNLRQNNPALTAEEAASQIRRQPGLLTNLFAQKDPITQLTAPLLSRK